MAATTRHHQFGGLKHQKCILPRFWRPEVPNQGVGRVRPSGGSEGESVPCLSPGFWRLPAVPGVRSCADAWLASPPLPSRGRLPASVSSPLRTRTPVAGFRTLSKCYFQIDAIHRMGLGHGRVFWGIYRMQIGGWPLLWRKKFQLRFLPIKCGMKDLSLQTRIPACMWL